MRHTMLRLGSVSAFTVLVMTALVPSIIAADLHVTGVADVDAVIALHKDGMLTATSARTLIPANQGSRCVLLAPGAQPTPLRYELKPGRAQRILLEFINDHGSKGPDTRYLMAAVPDITVGSETTISAVAGNAQWTVTTSIFEIGTEDRTNRKVHGSSVIISDISDFGKYVGLSENRRIDASGQILAYSNAVPEAAPADRHDEFFLYLSGQTGSRHVAFPAEPVGIGGRWLMMQRLIRRQERLIELSVMSLTARSATAVGITFNSRFLCYDPSVTDSLPNKPGINLRKYSGTMSGTASISLTTTAVLSASWTYSDEVSLRFKGFGGRQDDRHVERVIAMPYKE